MKTIIEIIKFFAASLATLCGLACLAAGVFCLYGGPDGFHCGDKTFGRNSFTTLKH